MLLVQVGQKAWRVTRKPFRKAYQAYQSVHGFGLRSGQETEGRRPASQQWSL